MTRTDEYSSVFGFRKAIRGTRLMLHYQPRGAAVEPRLGLVVGRKLVRSAVARNRLKRVLREQFRLERPRLPAFDLVFRVIAKSPRIDRAEIASEALALFARLPRRSLANAE